MGWKWTVLAIWTTVVIPMVAGQVTTNVTCRATSQWMSNSLGQNPCEVTAYLSSVCNKGEWFVPALVGQGPYNPPEGSGVSTCRCNTVTYSMLQACSACQDGLSGTWANWITYCPSSWVGKSYPNSVPAGTVIPSWATALDPTISGIWNATAAQAYAATATSSQTGSSSGHHKSNAGPIAGGVIGGIAALVIGALLVWWCMQRSSRGKGQKVTPAAYNDPGLMDGPYHTAGYVEKPTNHDQSHTGGYSDSGPYSSAGPFKPYDPSDPSTFPTSPAPTSTYVGHDITGSRSGNDYQSGGYPSHGYPPYQGGTAPGTLASSQPQHRPGQYTGAAEV